MKKALCTVFLFAITILVCGGCAHRKNTSILANVPYGSVSRIVICDVGFPRRGDKSEPAPGDPVWLEPTEIRITDSKSVRELHRMLSEAPHASKPEGIYWLNELCSCIFVDSGGRVLAIAHVNTWDCEVFLTTGRFEDGKVESDNPGPAVEGPYLKSTVRSEEFCRYMLTLMRKRRPEQVKTLNKKAQAWLKSSIEDFMFRNDIVVKKYNLQLEQDGKP